MPGRKIKKRDVKRAKKEAIETLAEVTSIEAEEISESINDKAGVIDEVSKSVAEQVREFQREKEREGAERIPGKVIGSNKIAWTKAEIAKRFPTVSLVPAHTIPITYNGVKYQLIQGVTMYVPSVIRDQYYDCMRKLSRAGQKLPNVGYTNEIGLGAGALTPE